MNRVFTFLVLISASISSRAQHKSPNSDPISQLQAQTPQLDTPPPPNRKPKPVLLTGEIKFSDVVAAEPRLNWKKWTEECSTIVAKAMEDNPTPDYIEGKEFEVVILPFGLKTTRPPQFKFKFTNPRCPPFPEGTAIKKVVMGVDIIGEKETSRDNKKVFQMNMESTPEVQVEEGNAP